MTDSLKRLQDALKNGVPEPDMDAKTRAIRLAQKNFNARQDQANVARLKNIRSENRFGLVERITTMFANLGMRHALLTTSSLAVVGIGVLLVDFNDLPNRENGISELPETETYLEEKEDQELEILAEPLIAEADDTVRMKAAAPSPGKPAKSRLAPKPVAGLTLEGELDERSAKPFDENERFANAAPDPLKITAEQPVSTFSIDVDTASYAYIRSAINSGKLPQADSVRIEEMVNYFPYSYPAPKGDAPFSTSVSVLQTPWNSDTKLVHIGIQGEKVSTEERPPLDLVFLIDTSGSMQDANKLPLLKQSFRLLLSKLSANDNVSIVTYAGSSGVVLEPTSASDRKTILASLDRLEAGGSTSGQAGLQLAYMQASKMKAKDRVGRILLATDGDFNVGISDPEELKAFIANKRDSGTYLSVLGFGRGNYNDALMQSLAQNGNGTAGYIDTLSEAKKLLVDQVSGALFPIANDVKIQVEFNPAQIAEYRLLGYETRALAREDFNNDKVDAGDIGAGHAVTAIYEVTPVGSPAIMSDPLRYEPSPDKAASSELGFLKLRYKLPGQSVSKLIATPITDGDSSDLDVLFSAAIAGFGQLLRNGKYLGDWTYQNAIDLAAESTGADVFGYRHEAINLMRLAKSLSE